MAFIFTGRLFTYVAMAWRRRRQAMTKKVALTLEPRGPDLRHFLRPQLHLAMAWRRCRQAIAK